jgi:hypothetical protein
MSSADETVLRNVSRTGGGITLHRTDDNGEPLCDKIGEGQKVRETDLSKFPPAWRDWCTVCEFIEEHGSYPAPSDYPLDGGNDE